MVTIGDIRTNVSVLEKSTKLNCSKCEKDKETDFSRKVKGKTPMDDLNVRAPEASGTTQESHSNRFID